MSEKKPDLRRRILDGAYGAFCMRTYAGAQVPFIAEVAQTAVGSLYRYFPSKEDLGNAAYHDAVTDLLARVRQVHAARHPSIRAEFAQYWQCNADFASERTAAYKFLAQDNTAFLNEENLALRQELYTEATGFIRRGQEASRIRSGDPRQLVALLHGALLQWGAYLYPAKINDLPQDQRETAEEACWGILKA
ncbi:TetR/AcrR family transcriptional regulator [Streptacidiphilus rugosus]|uniref:TetR/AcrR family transcriptional regulator n=1 Tax=Streptacidiphilus rugosus TaxID=405783 RepID=UPI000567AFD9|nr:TetR/AcrR family transcriptional regulator [Streptacidiphilus rugosus]